MFHPRTLDFSVFLLGLDFASYPIIYSVDIVKVVYDYCSWEINLIEYLHTTDKQRFIISEH